MIGFCPNAIEERGKVFVLNCTVHRKKEILKDYFGHKAPLYKTAKAGVDQLIEDYFSKMEVAATAAPAAVVLLQMLLQMPQEVMSLSMMLCW